MYIVQLPLILSCFLNSFNNLYLELWDVIKKRESDY